MAPYESHKLGDYFLKEFFKSAIKEYSLNTDISLSLKDIAFLKFDDAEIRREYKNIDLLIVSPQNKFVCIVENKIWTGEHDCQLERYAGIVDTEFKDYQKLYIYLAPYNDCESELLERNNKESKIYYIPMNYEQVHNIINKVLRFKSDTISQDVRIFIEHYNNMIERNIMGQTDKQIVELCRKIYRENKVAIDLINENNDFKTELFEILLEKLHERNDVDVISNEDKCIVCLPTNITNVDKLKFADWKPDDIIVHLHYVCNFKWKKCLYVEIGVTGKYETDSEDNIRKRNELIDFLKNKLEKKFNVSDKWAYTTYQPLMTPDEYYKCSDSSEVKLFLENKLNEIQAVYIDGLRDALNEFCK